MGLSGYGAKLIGIYGDAVNAVAAVLGLWESMGCCACGVGLMGIYWALWLRWKPYGNLWGHGADLWVFLAAVQTLWGSMGMLWLWCGTYGNLWGALAAV